MGTRPKPKPPLYVEDVLSFAHCQELAEKMASVDQQECISLGMSPQVALTTAAMLGYSRAVIRRRTGGCVGAFGFSPSYGTIWSLWAPLGLRESGQVLEATRGWVSKMQHAAGTETPLFNYVSDDNERVLKWLDAVGCFRFPEREREGVAPGHKYFEVSL